MNLLAANAEFWLAEGGMSLSQIRRMSPKPWSAYMGPDNGWHLSYFGGPHAVQQKLREFAHREFSGPEFSDLNRIKEAMLHGVHPQPEKGGLVPTIKLSRPRIVYSGHRRFGCWVDSLNDAYCLADDETRDTHEGVVVASASASGQGCIALFARGLLSAHSSGFASFAAVGNQQLIEQNGCESSLLPAIYLRTFVRLWRYIEREWSGCPQLQVLADGGWPDVLSFGLCAPIRCLSDGRSLISLAQSHFFHLLSTKEQFRGLAERGMKFPPWRAEDAFFEAAPPLVSDRRVGHGRRLLDLLPGINPGTQADRRLVLTHFQAAGGHAEAVDILHIFLGSLRRSQVAARAAVLVEGAAATAACRDLVEHYEADCAEVESLLRGESFDPVAGSAYMFWRAAEKFLEHRAPLAAEVWVGAAGESFFQSDPFVAATIVGDRGAALPALVMGAGRSSAAADEELHRQCQKCGGLGPLRERTCDSLLQSAVSGSAWAMGPRGAVLNFLGEASALALHAGDACDSRVILALAALAPRLRTTGPATLAAQSCTISEGALVRVSARGEVLDSQGRSCAVVGQYHRCGRLSSLAQRCVPGNDHQRIAALARLPMIACNGTSVSYSER